MDENKNSYLMIIATAATFILLGLLIFFPIPDENAQIFLAVSSFVLGFYFGTGINKSRPNTERKGDPNDPTITAEKITIVPAVPVP